MVTRVLCYVAHDAPIRMAFPLVFLAFGSIFIGYLTKDMIIGVGTQFWGTSLFILKENMSIIRGRVFQFNQKIFH